MIFLICIALCLTWLGTASITHAAGTSITITTDNLNVRKGPGLEYGVLTTLNKGGIYSVLKEEDEWTQIQLQNNEKGWVANYLINKNEGESPSQTSSAEQQSQEINSSDTGLVTANSLNFRAAPSLDADVVGKLYQGTHVKIISKRNDWVEIQYAGQTGWISGEYIQLSQEENHTETNVQTLEDTTLTIVHNGTNIRKNPNTQSTILQRANAGETFRAIHFENDWYEIQLPDGQTGYVANWVVSEQNEELTQSTSNEENHSEISHNDLSQYLANKKIVIDPGHGGKDGGTTGTRGTLEKELTLETARHLFDKLRAAGADVTLTRQRDKYLNLPYRVNVANEQNADAFISIHYDSTKDRNVRGLTTYFYYPWQKELAVNIHSAVIDETKMNDRGARFGDYYVIRENNKKAVLIELGYLSNPAEELHVQSNQYQESAATGIYEGLARYFKEQ